MFQISYVNSVKESDNNRYMEKSFTNRNKVIIFISPFNSIIIKLVY